MDSTQRRYLFIVCICVRLLIVYLVYKTPKKYLSFVGVTSLLVSLGFLNSFLKYKKDDRGLFDGEVWWNNLRLVHSIMYFIFGVLSLVKVQHHYRILLVDILIGIIGFIFL